jgi:serine/threonine protein kinase
MGDCLYLRAEWTPGELLGSGNFAKVYTLKDDGKYIIKISRIVEEDLYFPDIPLSSFSDRVEIQNKLAKADYSVAVVDSWECDGEYGVVVMKRLDQNLKSYMGTKGKDVLWVLKELYKLVHGMHAIGIVHGDLKLENVMVDFEKLFLIDFDYARVSKDKTLIKQDLLQLEEMTRTILTL